MTKYYNSLNEILDTELEILVKKTKEYIKGLLPKGKLKDSISYKKLNTGAYVIYTNVEYAPYVEFGTGIYGSRRQRIKPVRAEALRFEIDDQVIFAKSVKGQQGQFFFKKGLEYFKNLLSGRQETKSFTTSYFAKKNKKRNKGILRSVK